VDLVGHLREERRGFGTKGRHGRRASLVQRLPRRIPRAVPRQVQAPPFSRRRSPTIDPITSTVCQAPAARRRLGRE
jgi:hypothetical protein